MEEKKEAPKRTRSPNKKKFYVGYQYQPKNTQLYSYKMVESMGVPEMQKVQKEIEKERKTANVVIVSCFESK